MKISFENKVALITGAGSGLGLAAAKAFAEAGAAVVLADWKENSVRSVAEKMTARGLIAPRWGASSEVPSVGYTTRRNTESLGSRRARLSNTLRGVFVSMPSVRG
jgi:NAD(P)-dependent dehydrogenase (short-subunit alcohol dehydrogenase family)